LFYKNTKIVNSDLAYDEDVGQSERLYVSQIHYTCSEHNTAREETHRRIPLGMYAIK